MERMPKLGLKRQPRRNEHTVSKPGALAVISGDHMAMTMTTGLTEGRVLDQHSRLLDPDTSSVLDAGPCFGKMGPMDRGAEA